MDVIRVGGRKIMFRMVKIFEIWFCFSVMRFMVVLSRKFSLLFRVLLYFLME